MLLMSQLKQGVVDMLKTLPPLSGLGVMDLVYTNCAAAL